MGVPNEVFRLYICCVHSFSIDTLAMRGQLLMAGTLCPYIHTLNIEKKRKTIAANIELLEFLISSCGISCHMLLEDSLSLTV